MGIEHRPPLKNEYSFLKNVQQQNGLHVTSSYDKFELFLEKLFLEKYNRARSSHGSVNVHAVALQFESLCRISSSS